MTQQEMAKHIATSCSYLFTPGWVHPLTGESGANVIERMMQVGLDAIVPPDMTSCQLLVSRFREIGWTW